MRSGVPAAVRVADLGCVRGGRRVFAGVGFGLQSGQALQLTGSNGSGKSSLLRILCGLLEAEAGSVTMTGADRDSVVADHCHYLGHDNAHKPALTVAANLEFWRVMFGPTGLSVAAGLEAVGLDHLADLPAGYLSAGQKRRLAIARLVVSRRFLWLLDEPTAALDADSEAVFGGLVSDHLASGGAAIAATHMALPFAVSASLDLSARGTV